MRDQATRQKASRSLLCAADDWETRHTAPPFTIPNDLLAVLCTFSGVPLGSSMLICLSL
jgi:hypothetical protein